MSEFIGTEVKVNSLEELKVFWEQFIPTLSSRCILLLNGEVGAGKTTSVQKIAEILGLKNVQSPSFAIHLHYENEQGFSLDHLDLYRLEDDDDLESSGFWDIFSVPKGMVIIEWSQLLNREFLPMNWQQIEVSLLKTDVENQRVIKISK